MEDRGTADGKPATDGKMNVAWHMKDMAGELQQHAQDAFGDVGDHAQGLAGEVAHHSQQAAVEVRRETPVLIEHVRDTVINLFGNVRHGATRK